ncbi:MAG: long-chain fatty acid--CoA ligase [Jaaginema sp. PMC 1079.18]|nr:long-chain fatty acid--CoA ligase [Jaaginema sp. PMC 1080.18]MEC4853530.1 long-chain fatty acid--CoA ligase [Jaaginema sp. PMC 1079.18]MEC4865074.1 long-chain fatty acid--CoA ligase [Jaaginema sp. PMC 1078.18]
MTSRSTSPGIPQSFGNYDYSEVKCLPEVWRLAAKQFSATIALHDPHSSPEVKLTYKQLYQEIQQFAAGLQAMGSKVASKVALFADNSPRWFVADQGSMAAGAVNVVRSSAADYRELLYIYEHSDSSSLIVEDYKTFEKLRPGLANCNVEFVVLLSDEEVEDIGSLTILNYQQLMVRGENRTLQLAKQKPDTLATLLYTSGTTGRPKGVMLTHGNLLHQVNTAGTILKPKEGDRVLSILPSWHAYERAAEYYLLSQGCTQIYTNIRYFKQDLQEYQPNYMVAVPRLWESVYEGVQKKFRSQPENKQRLVQFFLGMSERYIKAKRLQTGLDLENPKPTAGERFKAQLQTLLLAPIHGLGDRLVYNQVRAATGGQIKCTVSGGGSLARHLDTFYEIVGVPLVVGYGLTETAPIASARRLEHNLRGSSGRPLPYTEIRIVHPETHQTLPPREVGLVYIRGPQVMQGYYKNPEATAKVLDEEGWFNSGDLGWVTRANDLVLTGRAKDTIVLSSGENIEPQPIEDACVRSDFIDQMMLVGQDQRALGALIVPNLDALQKWVKEQNLLLNIPTEGETDRKDIDNDAIYQLFRQELQREVKDRPGYRPDDRIGTFYLLLEPFTIENGLLTQTLKIRRPVVYERHRDIINGMFEK